MGTTSKKMGPCLWAWCWLLSFWQVAVSTLLSSSPEICLSTLNDGSELLLWDLDLVILWITYLELLLTFFLESHAACRTESRGNTHLLISHPHRPVWQLARAAPPGRDVKLQVMFFSVAPMAK